MSLRPLRKLGPLLLLGAFFFSLGLRLLHYPLSWKHFEDLFFYEGRPLLVGMDGYYYLRLSRDLLEGHYEPVDELRPGAKRPWPPPLIVVIPALLERLGGLDHRWVAFFLPAVFSAFLVVPLYLWGARFAGPLGGFWAALLAAGNYYWYLRTPLGRFDTDPLIPVLVFLVPYFFLLRSEGARRLVLLWPVLFGALLWWWWPKALYLLPGLFLASYGATVFLVRRGEVRRLLSFLLLALLPGLIWVLDHFFGSRVPLFHTAWEHVLFLLGKTKSGLPVRVAELEHLSFSYLTHTFSPSPVLFLGAVLGLLLLLRQEAPRLVVLIFPFVLAGFSVFARRFLIFAVPFYALGLSALLALLTRRAPRPWLRGLLLVLGLLVVVWNTWPALKKTPSPLVNRWQARVVAELGQKVPQKTVVWSWWDYGYFIQYYARRPTLADGGLQEPERILVLAVPLVARDGAWAGSWMRFFVRHQPTIFGRLISFRGVTGAFEEIEPRLRRAPHAGPPVALLLLGSLFEKSAWARYGLFRGGIFPEATVLFLKKDYRFDPEKGLVVVREEGRERRFPVQEAYYLFYNPWPGVRNHLRYRQEGEVFFQLLQVPFAYLFDPEVARGLAVRLFFLSPRDEPGFRLLSYVPLQAGAWLLE